MHYFNMVENEVVRVDAVDARGIRLFECNKLFGRDVYVLVDNLPAGATLAFDPKLTNVELTVDFETPEDLSFNVNVGKFVLTNGVINKHGHMLVDLSIHAGPTFDRVRHLVLSEQLNNDGAAIMCLRQAIDVTPKTSNDRSYSGMYFKHVRACLTEGMDTIICQYEIPTIEGAGEYVNINTEFGHVVALRVGMHAYVKVEGDPALQSYNVFDKFDSLYTLMDSTRNEFKQSIVVSDNVVYLRGLTIGHIEGRKYIPKDERCNRYVNLINNMYFRN